VLPVVARLRTRHAQCDFWAVNILCIFSSGRFFADEMEKNGVMPCNKMIILTDSFIPLHALLFWIRIEVVDPHFILNNELWNKFLPSHVGIVQEVLWKLVCSSGVSILDTIWQTLCPYAEMHKIFTAQKSYCACRVLSLATIRSKYYFNFNLNIGLDCAVFYVPSNTV